MYIHQVKINNDNNNVIGDIILQENVIYLVEDIIDSQIIIRNSGYFNYKFSHIISQNNYLRKIKYDSNNNQFILAEGIDDNAIGYILPVSNDIAVGSSTKIYLFNY